MRRKLVLVLFGLAAAVSTGCRSYRLEPPAGMAEVDRYSSGARMKASDNVGLNLRVFGNVRGGSLAFWSEDLVRKLALRGYTLESQTPAKSKNGVVGTRFDFSYVPPATDDPPKKFYTVVLFPTDKHVFALQLAGDDARRSTWAPRIDDIVDDLVVRGCNKPWTGICKGPQPSKLSTSAPPAAPAKPAGGAPAADAPAGEAAAKTAG
jgi:hypothetical protein